MPKRGKVGTGGQEIMRSLYGNRPRPETEAYADLCAERQRNLREARQGNLKILKQYSVKGGDR